MKEHTEKFTQMPASSRTCLNYLAML